MMKIIKFSGWELFIISFQSLGSWGSGIQISLQMSKLVRRKWLKKIKPRHCPTSIPKCKENNTGGLHSDIIKKFTFW